MGLRVTSKPCELSKIIYVAVHLSLKQPPCIYMQQYVIINFRCQSISGETFLAAAQGEDLLLRAGLFLKFNNSC